MDSSWKFYSDVGIFCINLTFLPLPVDRKPVLWRLHTEANGITKIFCWPSMEVFAGFWSVFVCRVCWPSGNCSMQWQWHMQMWDTLIVMWNKCMFSSLTPFSYNSQKILIDAYDNFINHRKLILLLSSFASWRRYLKHLKDITSMVNLCLTLEERGKVWMWLAWASTYSW